MKKNKCSANVETVFMTYSYGSDKILFHTSEGVFVFV